ncbi:MAG: D-glycero-beta-D-manno-heptose 1,7-bisphosphate 7-phosphatase [Methylococcales bacterium]|nr:D-glycero-beta-D-manno-heptose 1,7-bisphosphate 7-phosphatase [Methylococcales bacterium]
MKNKKIVLLDRDGVINHDSDNYIKSPDEWIPIPGSLEAIAKLNQAGYKVIVLTNQSGISRNYFTVDTLSKMHEKFYQLLENVGGHIEALFFCPHLPEDQCDCRKPKPGLFDELVKRMNLSDLNNTPYVGDSYKDIEVARKVNATPILVKTGKGERTISQHSNDLAKVGIYNNLADFVNDYLRLREN